MDAAAAERWLASLEPLGWRLGLERIRALTDELGRPQERFRSAHVVGTNGKSSVTALAAALCEAHGHPSGAYLSPHLHRWSERVLAGGHELEPAVFAAAAERVREACARVEARLPEPDRVTQFEAATAVAFEALAAAGVEIAVVEAGLGGRLDATNVIPSEVTSLVSVGLDHTQWLGETRAEIAREKLAVLRPRTALVLGELDPEVEAIAREHAARLGAEVIEAPAPGGAAPYPERNLAVAAAVARRLVGELDPERIRAAAAQARLPGRLERLGGEPPVLLDAAHNPDGAAALAAGQRGPVVACLAILADKDAAGIVAALAPRLAEAWCCEVPAELLAGSGRPGAEPFPAARLAELCRASGVAAHAEADTERAVACAVERARELRGVALLAGSHYLLRYRWTARRAQSSCK